MAKPIIAIVGRPNVGKSTFFNRIAGERISIIEDIPGVTRDRIYADGEWLGVPVTMIDTGGISIDSDDMIESRVREQAFLAVDSADLILFFTDAKQGILPEDHEVASVLRRSDKPVITVVNKVDNLEQENDIYDFYELGLGDIYSISAVQGLGIGDLLDAVIAQLPDKNADEEDPDSFKIALVGKPNVGKSSLANRILGHDRSIVSDIPGTTRDAIDSDFVRNGKKYTIIDTAGLRKKSRIEDKTVERFSVIRTLNAVRRADVTVLMIDANEGVSEQDLRIAGFIVSEGKPCVLCINKWDAIEKDTNTINEFKKDILTEFSFMTYAETVFISALTGQRIDKLFDACKNAKANSEKRIKTGILNECLSEATSAVAPPSDKGRRLKVFYATQVAVKPPSFVLFVNDTRLMHFSYLRYLENYFRKTFDFSGTPIKIMTRERDSKKDEEIR